MRVFQSQVTKIWPGSSYLACVLLCSRPVSAWRKREIISVVVSRHAAAAAAAAVASCCRQIAAAVKQGGRGGERVELIASSNYSLSTTFDHQLNRGES